MLSELWVFFFLLVIAIGLFTSHGIITAVGGMGFLVGLVSWFWNKVSLERVTYERELSSNRAFLGEEVYLSISLTNKKPIPLGWLTAQDDVPDAVQLVGTSLSTSGKPETHTLVHSTSVAGYERVRWSYTVKPRRRGYFRFGPVSLRSGDLFGLFSSHRRDPFRDSLLVYPKIVPMEEMVLPPVRPFGETKGGLTIIEDTTRPAGVRDYRFDDPMKRIDWKATARHQELQIKMYEPSVSHVVVIILSVDTVPYHWGGYFPVQLERAVTAAASTAVYAVDKGYMVGFFSNGTPILAERPMNIGPARNPQHLTIILEVLATVGPVTTGPMPEVMARQARRFPLGATLVLVAAAVSDKMSESMDYLVSEGHRLVLMYVGDEELPTLPTKVQVHDLSGYFKRLEDQS